MLRINVSGYVGEGKSQIISIIKDALVAGGKRVLTVEDRVVTANPTPNAVDVVIIETHLAKSPSSLSVDFDFVIGRTESEAYELLQDSGYVVWVSKRNSYDIPFGGMNKRTNLVQLEVVDNTVVSWSIL